MLHNKGNIMKLKEARKNHGAKDHERVDFKISVVLFSLMYFTHGFPQGLQLGGDVFCSSAE